MLGGTMTGGRIYAAVYRKGRSIGHFLWVERFMVLSYGEVG
jgi:hypothetical protein